jgi:hypothetical protein
MNTNKQNKQHKKLAAKPTSIKFSSGGDFSEWALTINSMRMTSMKV